LRSKKNGFQLPPKNLQTFKSHRSGFHSQPTDKRINQLTVKRSAISKFFQSQTLSNFAIMRPDFPYKIFPDHRTSFNLLMETLAMDNL
jgi:hypothetical protein